MQKNILILFTGGTIAGNVAVTEANEDMKSDSHSFSKIVENAITIIKKTWGTDIGYDVKELFNIDSSNVLPEHWAKITNTIQKEYENYDAFIVMHGTNTMGYTSSALSFALDNIDKPVVLTGAQVPLGYLGSDATTNLVNSLRICVWKYTDIKGVMAVFGSKVITGTRVKKGTDYDYDPFKSFITGSLGQIGRYIRVDEKALERHNSYLSKRNPLAQSSGDLVVINRFETDKIVSITEHPGLKAEVLVNLVKENALKGVIFRAFGAGDPNEKLYPFFEYLKENGIPIVVTTQAPSGISNFQVNETGQYLAQHDLAIPAHDMSMESMVTKLSWLIGQNKDYSEIKKLMLEDLHGEIHIEQELR
jgi:L-asparaginase